MGPEGQENRYVPPQDLAAEQGVLGGVLVHGADALAGVAATLMPGDFYDRRHGTIYKAMLDLYDKDSPVDEITVSSRLTDRGQLEQVGGALYLAQLADMIPTQYFVDAYASLVRDKALLRDLIAALYKALEKAYENLADPSQAIEGAEKAIFAATERRFSSEISPMSELVVPAIKIITERFRNKGQVTGITTGFKYLDKMTTGWQNGDLVIIAGRPSMGKTAFALNLASNACLMANVPVVVFSLEMSKEQLAIRLLASEAGVSGERIRSGFLLPDDHEKLTAAADTLSKAPFFIDDTPGISVLELRAKARRLKKQGLGMIVVDYLQLMSGRGNSERREQEISDISRSLKALAKEVNVPVLALSQLNRKVEDRPGEKRPMLSDLRESGAIEQDADIIAFIYRKKVYKKKEDPEESDDNMAEIIIGKQRNGPTGTVKLTFIDDQTKFADRAYEEESPDYRE